MEICGGGINAKDIVLIPEQSPFPIDILNRQPFVDQLIKIINILSESRSSCTFAINGAWGSGKTFVLDILERQLRDYKAGEQYLVFHYNCWQYDYYEEPLIAIVSSMLDSIDQQAKIISEGVKNAAKLTLSAVMPVAKSIATSFVKSKFGVDIKESLELIKDGQEGVAEALKEAEEQYVFDKYFNFNSKLSDAREELHKLSEDRTLVIIVDELDRCQPDYAIKVLERLHHLFYDMENIIVVLSVDRKQLEKTVEHIFGDATDTESYLQKFINFEIALDAGQVNTAFREKFLDYVSLFDDSVLEPWPGIDRFLSALFSGTNIRTQEHLLKRVQAVHKLLFDDKEKDYAFMCCELLLAFMSLSNRGLDKAPFYYDYNKAKQCYSLFINPSLQQPLLDHISDEWTYSPGILQDGHGHYPLLYKKNIDIPQLLIIYFSMLYGHPIRVEQGNGELLSETVSDLRKVSQLLELIK